MPQNSRRQRGLFDARSERVGRTEGESTSGRERSVADEGGKTLDGPALFTGPFPAIESVFAADLIKCISDDPLGGVIVFVPTYLARLYLRRKLALAGVRLCNAHFWTLDGFVLRAVSSLGGPKHLSPQGAAVLASHIAEDALEGTYFDKVRQLHGFHHALLATVIDLKEACLTPEILQSCLDKDLSTPLRKKLAAILQFWRAYEQRKETLGEGDLPDLYRYVIPQLDHVPLFKGISRCFFYGYYDFKGIQYELVRAFVTQRPCSFYVPVETGFSVAEYVRPAVDSLTGDLGCWEQEVKLSTDGSTGGDKRSSALRMLQCDLFAGVTGQTPAASDPSVRLVSIPTDATEPDHVVRLVADALAEKRPGHSVAVITRTAGQAYPYIVALESHGIQLADVTQVPLSVTAAGTVIATLLELASEQESSRRFPRQDVLRLLEATSGLLGEEAEWPQYLPQFEAITRQAAIVSGKEEWERGLGHIAGLLERQSEAGETAEGDEAISRQAVTKLRKIAKRLFSALDSLTHADSWDGAVQALTRALHTLFEDADALPEHVVYYLSGLKELGKYAERFSLPLFLVAAHEFLDAVPEKCERPHYMEGGVVVTDIMSARGARFDVVILPGVAERQIPLPFRQDPILLDDERESINRALGIQPPILQLPLRRRRTHEERLLFKLAIDSAGKQVVLTFPRVETGTARPMLPSPYLIDVLRVLGVKEPTYRAFHEQQPLPCVTYVPHRVADPAAWALSKTDFLRRCVVRAAHERTASKPVPWAAAAALNATLAQALRAERKRWGTRKHTEYDGRVCDSHLVDVLARALIHGRKLTVSMLDDYGSCPYAFFLRYALGLDEDPDPVREYRVSPARLGSIAHEILHRTFEQFDKPPPTVDELVEAMHREAAAVFAEAESTGTTGFPVLWRWEKQQLIEQLEELVQREYERLMHTGRWVWACERPVGDSQNGLALQDGTIIAVRGRIDRIDRAEDGTWHVVDYKASKLSKSSAQLTAYAAVAAQEYSRELPGERFGGIETCYYRLSNRRTYVEAESPSFEELMQLLGEMATRLVNGVSQGDFRQVADDGVCSACSFGDVCMNMQFVIARIKGTPSSEPSDQ